MKKKKIDENERKRLLNESRVHLVKLQSAFLAENLHEQYVHHKQKTDTDLSAGTEWKQGKMEAVDPPRKYRGSFQDKD
jgi:hypothetical protein